VLSFRISFYFGVEFLWFMNFLSKSPGSGLSAFSPIEFVNSIINHLTEHGVMDAALLYESPFTDLTPQSPEGIFSSGEVDALIATLNRIRAAADAA
jgi:hypothetical protein